MFTCVGVVVLYPGALPPVWRAFPAGSSGCRGCRSSAGQQVARAEQVQVLIDLEDQVVAVVQNGVVERLGAAAGRRKHAPGAHAAIHCKQSLDDRLMAPPAA